jgi:hypothetical protein
MDFPDHPKNHSMLLKENQKAVGVVNEYSIVAVENTSLYIVVLVKLSVATI